ncbi:unnamed protein product, partial [Strongylus vulgaris]
RWLFVSTRLITSDDLLPVVIGPFGEVSVTDCVVAIFGVDADRSGIFDDDASTKGVVDFLVVGVKVV